MSAEPLYVVMGASGRTGSAVADALISRRCRVRVLGRTLERLERFAAAGAEPFLVHPMDADRMRRAFDGCTIGYVMLQPNYISDSVDFRGFQRSLIASIAPAVATSALTHVVSLSSWGADEADGTGPVLGLRDLELTLNAIAKVNVLHLRAGWFMENAIPMLQKLEWANEFSGPIAPDLLIPMVSANDVGAVAASEMMQHTFTGKVTREVRGPRCLTLSDIADIVGRWLGSNRRYVQASPEAFREESLRAGNSEHITAQILQVATAMNTGHIAMRAPGSGIVSTYTTFEAFAAQILRRS